MKKKDLNQLKKILIQQLSDLLGRSDCSLDELNVADNNISDILESEVTRQLLGDGRKVAVGLNAVTCFLTEEEIQNIMATLFKWAPQGSKLYATFETKKEGLMTPSMQQLIDMFAQIGSPYHFLTFEKSRELAAPWKVDAPGFQPLAEILGRGDEITHAEREGVGLEFYGVILST